MWAELGHYAMLLALSFAFLQCLLPTLGQWLGQPRLMQCGAAACTVQFYLLLLAFAGLSLAFLFNDFSVTYVAAHSNSRLPWYYRLSAVWGGHEGSLLLWIVILGGWSYAVTLKSPHLPLPFISKVMAVLGMISFCFLLFIELTSNPFRRILPFPFDGQDLNPLLQDIGLIFHPPMLYMGYVGFAIAFAFVVAALWHGRLDSVWLRWSRPWTLAAWASLSLGIALGSFWAYYELGWGGWWFWDPVENASLMPWLVGTALLHCLAAAEKRRVFLIWTALLAILAFSLSLLGTFLVRSGVLTSVHAFANDPTRGVFILTLLAVITLPALVLLVLRADTLVSHQDFKFISREMSILINNWLLCGACLMVFVGTLYPLLADVLGWGKISVGSPYFNALSVPLAILALFLISLAPLLRWRTQEENLPRLRWVILAALLLAGFATFLSLRPFGFVSPSACLGAYAAYFAVFLCAYDWLRALPRKKNLRALLPKAQKGGMMLAHLGFIVTCLGIVFTGSFSIEQDISIRTGDLAPIGSYQVKLLGLRELQGPNYTATRGIFTLSRDDTLVAVLHPEKRQYFSSAMPMTESARYVHPLHDIYLAMGERLNEDSWAVRVQYRPLIRLIWGGALLMALGAFWIMRDRRFRSTFKDGS